MDTSNQEQGWIEWAGGECPVPPETVVRFQIRAETREEAEEADEDWCDVPAQSLHWDHRNDGADIIAYRIVEGQ